MYTGIVIRNCVSYSFPLSGFFQPFINCILNLIKLGTSRPWQNTKIVYTQRLFTYQNGNVNTCYRTRVTTKTFSCRNRRGTLYGAEYYVQCSGMLSDKQTRTSASFDYDIPRHKNESVSTSCILWENSLSTRIIFENSKSSHG